MTTDINQYCGNDRQNVNDFAYAQQQVGINNNYRDTSSYNGNIENNVITTQANGLTYDHQATQLIDSNRIQQPQQ